MQLPRCNARPLMSQLVYNTVDHISSKSPILCHDAYHHFILEEDWDEMTLNEPKGGNRTCKIPGCGQNMPSCIILTYQLQALKTERFTTLVLNKGDL